MKNNVIFLLLGLCLMMTYTVHAQSDLENRVTTMLQDIDTAPIVAATGIFYDQVPEYMDLSLFNGSTIVDSLRAEEGHLLLAHDMLAFAHLDTINTLRQHSVWEVVESMKQTGV